MVPAAKDNLANRKNSNSLSKPSPSGLTNLDAQAATNGRKIEKKKFGKRGSIFHLQPTGNSSAEGLDEEPLSPLNSESSNLSMSRPRTLHKGKPISVFGSLGKKSTNTVKDKPIDTPEHTPGSSISNDGQNTEQMNGGRDGPGKKVLHYGEVQTTSGLFRKKKEYLVLTETHLIRYKSQSRASEVFPSIPSSFGRSGTTRHPSTASIGSLHDLQSLNSHASIEGDNAIPLKQIVTAYKVEDGRPFFTTEVVYLDEESNFIGSVQLMLNDPKEADLWHTSIRAAAQKARLISSQPFPERVILYLVNVLEGALDYDQAHFTIFRVVRRASGKAVGKSLYF